MITNTYLPPHPKAVEDLLSLLSIVTNPKAVSEYTKGLLEAAKAYTEASKGFVDKDSELKQRESQAIADLQRLATLESTLALREKEIERQEAQSADQAAKAYRLKQEYEEYSKAVEAAKAKLAHDRANFEQTSKSTTANLIEWERNLKNDLEAHHTKVKALKELIHV